MRAFRGFTLMRTNIRRALHLLILAVLLPVLALLVYTFVNQLNDAFDDEMQHDLMLAHAVGAAFEEHVRDIASQELTAGTALATPESFAAQQANQYLKAAAAAFASVISMDWLTPEAAVIASSSPSAGGPDLRSQPWFREVIADPGRPRTRTPSAASREAPSSSMPTQPLRRCLRPGAARWGNRSRRLSGRL